MREIEKQHIILDRLAAVFDLTDENEAAACKLYAQVTIEAR